MSEESTEKGVSPKLHKFYKSNEKKKDMFPGLLAENNGHIGKTCQMIGITRPTYHEWRKVEPAFAQACDDVNEYINDKLEDTILDIALNEKDIKMLMYAGNGRLSKRGYGNKKEVDVNVQGSEALNLKVDFIDVSKVKDE